MTNALRLPALTALGPDRSAEPRAAGATRDEESGWIRHARDGDPDAFRRLVDRYRDLAYEVALRIVRDPDDAEEVAQDAFVRAWRALPGFREESRFSTWLYRIVTRRALDAASSARRHSERRAPDLDPEALPDPAPTRPVTDALRLERVLGGLSPLRRAVLILFYLRERTVDEVAEILDLPSGTVKTHLHRGRAELRRAWRTSLVRERRRGLSDL